MGQPGSREGLPERRVDLHWLLQSCKYLLQVDRRRVDPLRWVEANPGSYKGGLREDSSIDFVLYNIILTFGGRSGSFVTQRFAIFSC